VNADLAAAVDRIEDDSSDDQFRDRSDALLAGAYIHVYIYVYIYIHIYICTHTYIYMYIHVLERSQ